MTVQFTFAPPPLATVWNVSCPALELSTRVETITGLMEETIEYLISPLVTPESFKA